VPRFPITFASAVFCLLLSGCTQWQAAASDTARSFIQQKQPADQVQLRTDLQYLRVNTYGSPALLVLGYIDRDAAQAQPVQVWYSADREVLRLQGGRLVGLTGAIVEWRNVTWLDQPPQWPTTPSAMHYTRQRDVMPGDHISIREVVTVTAIAPPRHHELRGLDPASLQWFEETAAPPADTPAALAAAYQPLPPARFALRRTAAGLVPVYGEQCLNATLCIQWQSWPPTPAQR